MKKRLTILATVLALTAIPVSIAHAKVLEGNGAPVQEAVVAGCSAVV